MRIDDLNLTPLAPNADKVGQSASQRTSEKEITANSDQAEVSQAAQALATTHLTNHDPAKIEQLRLEVQSGSYDVSAQTVANAVIDAHLKES